MQILKQLNNVFFYYSEITLLMWLSLVGLLGCWGPIEVLTCIGSEGTHVFVFYFK